jgi:hypothetical protein
MRRFSTTELAACGTVTETELEPLVGEQASLRRFRYMWRPTALTATQLPPEFEIPVLAYAAGNGERRFRDADDVKVYIARGFAAGVALFDRLGGLTREQRLEYRVPRFIYQYVQQTHAHLDCNFLSKRQLIIKRGSRGENQERNVLPPDLGYNLAGRGTRWTIDRLMEAGEEAAQEAIGPRPTTAEAIAHGLFAAARRNPVRLTTSRARAAVRIALFDADAHLDRPRRRLVARVQDRLYRLLDRHMDEPQADFDEWFFPAGGRNLPAAIARQPNQPGGVLGKEEVTGALLQLGWDAYLRLSECLGAFGQAFAAALPQRLTRRERTHYDLSMMPHRHFGGLPRWLLMERVEFLRPALEALMQNPRDEEVVGALHRLLTWYPEMVRKRREADRLSKRRQSNRVNRSREALTGGQEILESDLRQDGELESHYRRRRRNLDRRRDD